MTLAPPSLDDAWLPTADHTFRCATTLRGHVGPVNTVRVLQCGLVVSGGADRLVKVWNLQLRSRMFTTLSMVGVHTRTPGCATGMACDCACARPVRPSVLPVHSATRGPSFSCRRTRYCSLSHSALLVGAAAQQGGHMQHQGDQMQIRPEGAEGTDSNK